MTAIRIIDDHLELASIGTKSHVQIDTHIAAAGDYVKRDGSLALTADWDIGDTRKILADEIRARDAAGLKLYDDGGLGAFVRDGGNILVGGHETLIEPFGGFDTHDTATLQLYRGLSSEGINRKYATISFINNQIGTSHLVGSFTFINTAIALGEKRLAQMFCFTDTATNKGKFQISTANGAAPATRLTIKSNGNIGIGTTTPTAHLDVNSDIIRLRTAKTPASAGAAGNQGDICWDAGFIYVCTATNSWERAAIAAW